MLIKKGKKRQKSRQKKHFPRLPSQEDMLLLAGDGDTGLPAQRVLQAQLLGL